MITADNFFSLSVTAFEKNSLGAPKPSPPPPHPLSCGGGDGVRVIGLTDNFEREEERGESGKKNRNNLRVSPPPPSLGPHSSTSFSHASSSSPAAFIFLVYCFVISSLSLIFFPRNKNHPTKKKNHTYKAANTARVMMPDQVFFRGSKMCCKFWRIPCLWIMFSPL